MSESVVLFDCFISKDFSGTTNKLHVPVIAGNWQEVLREHIDPEQLPVVYGGTLTDPDGDPRCRTMVRERDMLADQNPGSRSAEKENGNDLVALPVVAD